LNTYPPAPAVPRLPSEDFPWSVLGLYACPILCPTPQHWDCFPHSYTPPLLYFQAGIHLNSHHCAGLVCPKFEPCSRPCCTNSRPPSLFGSLPLRKSRRHSDCSAAVDGTNVSWKPSLCIERWKEMYESRGPAQNEPCSYSHQRCFHGYQNGFHHNFQIFYCYQPWDQHDYPDWESENLGTQNQTCCLGYEWNRCRGNHMWESAAAIVGWRCPCSPNIVVTVSPWSLCCSSDLQPNVRKLDCWFF